MSADPTHQVIHFDALPSSYDRQILQSKGIFLQKYLGGNAYFAYTPPGLQIQSDAGIQISAIDPRVKIHPQLADSRYVEHVGFSDKSHAAMDGESLRFSGVYVLFYADVDIATEGRVLVENWGGQVRDFVWSLNGLVVWLPLDHIERLAGEDSVEWIEPALVPLQEVNDQNRVVTQVNQVQDFPYELDGQGITVLVYDGGTALVDHADFGGRLSLQDSTSLSDHATHVSGTIGGDGTASDGWYAGMAPSVNLLSYGYEYDGSGTFLYSNPGDIESDYDEAIHSYGAVLANNSIGTNICVNGASDPVVFDCDFTGDYGVTSQLLDEIARGSLGAGMCIILANGNERSCSRCADISPGGYHSTAPPACAKNPIAVGAIESDTEGMTSFSSWGPTDDGRLKPDICAPGCQETGDGGVRSTSSAGGYTVKCGTSMAAPTVTGISALIFQDFKQQYPTQAFPSNALLKVLLCHNASDLGNRGPDYQFGYGAVRARETIDFLRSGYFLEQSLDHGEWATYEVCVNPEDSLIQVTCAWDDPAGALNTVPELVNDLDLLLISPGGSLYYPWTLDPNHPSLAAVQTQADRRNNLEQVLVEQPEPGVWTVRVAGYSIAQGPQSYALAASPMLKTCTSQGTVSFLSPLYNCSSVATVQVIDCDLDLSTEIVDAVVLGCTSDSEPEGEMVLLEETGLSTGVFRGSISLSLTDEPNVLAVQHGDTITVAYEDSDTGTGSPALLTAEATIECIAPDIGNVWIESTEPDRAVIQFATDEPTQARIHYGTDCNDLSMTKECGATDTFYSVTLLGLTDQTQYFLSIEATDLAGNTAWENNQGQCYSFSTPKRPDYYTEQFLSGTDLEGYCLTFLPDGSDDFYRVCRETRSSFEIDPAQAVELDLGDDDAVEVDLQGQIISFYGLNYHQLYVGSNGFITLDSPDTDFTESLTEHFAQVRISMLYDDLNPAGQGRVSYEILTDRAVVTYENVPEWDTSNQNSFQLELFYGGTIRITWLQIDSQDGVVGLSNAWGLPSWYVPSNLSSYSSCDETPPVAQDDCVRTIVNTSISIPLVAQDDGLPNPPGSLTYIIESLPEHGQLFHSATGYLTQAPYSLPAGSSMVVYEPDPVYLGTDAFRFRGDDGGQYPYGGPGNVATVDLTVTARRVFFTEDFERDLGDFTIENDLYGQDGLWHRSQSCQASDPCHASEASLYYGLDSTCDYDTGVAHSGALTSPVIHLEDVEAPVDLWFRYLLETENAPGFDIAKVEISVNGGAYVTVADNQESGNLADPSSVWQVCLLDISAYAGQSIQIRFSFETVTVQSNVFAGFYVDDIHIAGYSFGGLVADFDLSGTVNGTDFASMAGHWLRLDCHWPQWCNGLDLNLDSQVGLLELLLLSQDWTCSD